MPNDLRKEHDKASSGMAWLGQLRRNSVWPSSFWLSFHWLQLTALMQHTHPQSAYGSQRPRRPEGPFATGTQMRLLHISKCNPAHALGSRTHAGGQAKRETCKGHEICSA